MSDSDGEEGLVSVQFLHPARYLDGTDLEETFEVMVDPSDTMDTLKFQVFSMTDIAPEEQLIFGFAEAVTNAPAGDDDAPALGAGGELPAFAVVMRTPAPPKTVSGAAALAAAGMPPSMPRGPLEGECRNMMSRIVSDTQHVRLYEQPANKLKALAAIKVAQVFRQAHEDAARREQGWCLSDRVLFYLLRWFKMEFFKWTNEPPCGTCGRNSCKILGVTAPDQVEALGLAGRVEVYKCQEATCGAMTRFPRYNHPGTLLDFRQGRCGEWANCFTLCCRAMGLDARHVMDWTDHVWTEVWSPGRRRWMHCDSCENNMDSPLLYEAGWGKKLSYVFAVSADEVVDVARRYSKKWGEVSARRMSVPEDWLAATVNYLDVVQRTTAGTGSDRWAVLRRRKAREAREFELNADPVTAGAGQVSAEELRGRISGSLQWRAARQELGPSATAGGAAGAAAGAAGGGAGGGAGAAAIPSGAGGDVCGWERAGPTPRVAHLTSFGAHMLAVLRGGTSLAWCAAAAAAAALPAGASPTLSKAGLPSPWKPLRVRIAGPAAAGAAGADADADAAAAAGAVWPRPDAPVTAVAAVIKPMCAFAACADGSLWAFRPVAGAKQWQATLLGAAPPGTRSLTIVAPSASASASTSASATLVAVAPAASAGGSGSGSAGAATVTAFGHDHRLFAWSRAVDDEGIAAAAKAAEAAAAGAASAASAGWASQWSDAGEAAGIGAIGAADGTVLAASRNQLLLRLPAAAPSTHDKAAAGTGTAAGTAAEAEAALEAALGPRLPASPAAAGVSFRVPRAVTTGTPLHLHVWCAPASASAAAAASVGAASAPLADDWVGVHRVGTLSGFVGDAWVSLDEQAGEAGLRALTSEAGLGLVLGGDVTRGMEPGLYELRYFRGSGFRRCIAASRPFVVGAAPITGVSVVQTTAAASQAASQTGGACASTSLLPTRGVSVTAAAAATATATSGEAAVGGAGAGDAAGAADAAVSAALRVERGGDTAPITSAALVPTGAAAAAGAGVSGKGTGIVVHGAGTSLELTVARDGKADAGAAGAAGAALSHLAIVPLDLFAHVQLWSAAEAVAAVSSTSSGGGGGFDEAALRAHVGATAPDGACDGGRAQMPGAAALPVLAAVGDGDAVVTASNDQQPHEGRGRVLEKSQSTKWFSPVDAEAATASAAGAACVAWLAMDVGACVPSVKARGLRLLGYVLTSANDWPSRDPSHWVLEGLPLDRAAGGGAGAGGAGPWVTLDDRSGGEPFAFSGRHSNATFLLPPSAPPCTAFRLRFTATADLAKAGSIQLARAMLVFDAASLADAAAAAARAGAGAGAGAGAAAGARAAASRALPLAFAEVAQAAATRRWAAVCPARGVTAMAATKEGVFAFTSAGEMWRLSLPASIRNVKADA